MSTTLLLLLPVMGLRLLFLLFLVGVLLVGVVGALGLPLFLTMWWSLLARLGLALLLLLSLPTMILLLLLPRTRMLRLTVRSLPRRIPNDLGMFGLGTPLFPMTPLQVPIWLMILLDPIASTLRRAQVVLHVLRV